MAASPVLSCVCWQWQRDDGGFSPYSPEVSSRIEQAYVSGKSTVPLSKYTVDTQKMEQKSKSSGYKRIVTRKPLQLSTSQSTAAYWTWAEHYNTFVPYDPEASIIIEEYYQNKYVSLDLSTTTLGLPYTLNFSTMEQKRHRYNTIRKIQRCPLPPGSTIQSLLAVPNVAMPPPSSYIKSYPSTVHSGGSTSFNSLAGTANYLSGSTASAPGLMNSSTQRGYPTSGLHPYPASTTLTGDTASFNSTVGTSTSMPYSAYGSSTSTPVFKSGSTTPVYGVNPTPLTHSYQTSFGSSLAPSTMSTVTACPTTTSSRVKSSAFSSPSKHTTTGNSTHDTNSSMGYPKSYSMTNTKSASLSKSGGVSNPGPVVTTASRTTKSAKTVTVLSTKPDKSGRGKNHKKARGGGAASKGRKVGAKKVCGLDERFSQYVRVVDWVKDDQDGPCPICMNNLTEEAGFDDDNPTQSASIPQLDVCKLRGCRHMLHRPCLLMYIKSTGTQSGFQCPNCKKSYGVKTGDMPSGTMTVNTQRSSLPGHEGYNTIVIVYNFRAGTHNGRRYRVNGFPRTCYLPDSPKGQKVLRLLRIAWERKLTFTIGTSVTTGATDTVVWNEIHHKTDIRNHGGHGYPDPNYLDNVLRELAAQGVEEGGSEGVGEGESEDEEVFVISSDSDDNV